MADEEYGCVGPTLKLRVAWFNKQIKASFVNNQRLRFDGSAPEIDECKGWFNYSAYDAEN